jgi:hypothetical protein
MRSICGLAVLLGCLVAGPAARTAARDAPLRVVDATTGRPIADAIVTTQGESRSDREGLVLLPAEARSVRVRAAGYLRAEVTSVSAERIVALTPFTPKALYLSVYGVGSRTLRDDALRLIERTELNAIVIDIKGDRGLIPYPSEIALAATSEALGVRTISDLKTFVADLHGRSIYAIARIVVFKDERLATARPALAVRRLDGSVYKDREDLAWTDPFNRDVWDYNIAIAIEAAAAGFDEVQFDYVRLPDAAGLRLREPSTAGYRRSAIEGFLGAARQALRPWNVFVAADVFGYVCWNLDDTGIGQHLGGLMQSVDYLSPMLYPSSFQYGIPDYRKPIEHPYEIVLRSLERAHQRTAVAPLRFRPWLQAFRDYAFGGRAFGGPEVRSQIEAAESFGANGWMLWNPRNRYIAEGLRPEAVTTPEISSPGWTAGTRPGS